MSIIRIDLDVILSDHMTEAEVAELLDHANDGEALGVDMEVPVETVTDAVTWLLMFDPAWLFERSYVQGWIADRVRLTVPTAVAPDMRGRTYTEDGYDR